MDCGRSADSTRSTHLPCVRSFALSSRGSHRETDRDGAKPSNRDDHSAASKAKQQQEQHRQPQQQRMEQPPVLSSRFVR
uniref:Uncharacterized protein n=1 Tax=Plectus sambesii TaxID=2011161 RepID=A0A914VNF5_9BILA